ncbi:MAG: DUF4350 domain-containing protein [Balneolaceae bacterium]
MMKKERTYFIILGALVLGFILVQILKPKPLDWRESFSAAEKIPYGGYIIHNLLEPVFPGQEIAVNTNPIFEHADTVNAKKNWLFLNTNFSLDEFEAEILLNQVQNGSNVFIAARTFGGEFGDTLNLATRYGNPVLGGGNILWEDTSHVNFTNPSLQKEKGWPYVQSTTETHFISVDSSRTSILGINSDGNPNFIKINSGDGNIFLHANPTLFTNYFVRDSLGADYALTALSYLPVQQVVWDEYYKTGRASEGGAVRYIVSQRYLKWAWFLSLAGIVLFMIFRAKRSQRIIPVIDPPKNSSIEFAQTIGNLYLEKGDHKLIADKKIRFFLDYIRGNLDLDTSHFDESLVKDIASRSGVNNNEIQTLFDLIEMTSQKEKITQHELKFLTQRIDRFYNKSQR